MQVGTVDLNKLRGVGRKFLGLLKELTGTLIGNDRMARAGEAEQERAAEELKALRKELEAERKQAKAQVHDARERAAQAAKS